MKLKVNVNLAKKNYVKKAIWVWKGKYGFCILEMVFAKWLDRPSTVLPNDEPIQIPKALKYINMSRTSWIICCNPASIPKWESHQPQLRIGDQLPNSRVNLRSASRSTSGSVGSLESLPIWWKQRRRKACTNQFADFLESRSRSTLTSMIDLI